MLIQAIGQDVTDIELKELSIHDVTGISEWKGGKWGNAGIRINGWNGAFHRVLIDGCRLEDVREIGIFVVSNVGANTEIRISNNQILRAGADGIIVQRTTKPAIVGNRVMHCGTNGGDFQYIAGIWTGNCSDSLIEGNEVAYNQGGRAEREGLLRRLPGN